MKRFVPFALVLLLVGAAFAQTPVTGNGTFSGFGEFDSGPGLVPATLFGLHFSLTRGNFGGFGYTGIPWPGVTFGSLRLWDTNTNWLLMNPSAGVYSFTSLDSYLAAAKTNGLTDVMLTLGGTPAFISSDATNTNCDYGSASGLIFYGLTPNYANGSCGAPTDVNTDGSGTDQTWRDYIYHLGLHIQGLSSSTYATVNWFEIWNEFTRGSSGSCGGEVTQPTSWEGTCAQLVRLAQDADCILTGRGTITGTAQTCTAAHMNEPAVNLLPNAGVLTPDAVPQQPDIVAFGTYVGTTGALNFMDEIAVHAYAFQGLGTTLPDSSSTNSNAAGMPAMWNALQGVLPSAAFNIPIWSTEGSWGPSPSSTGGVGYLPDPDMQMGYIARYFLVGWSSGFRRLYWYAANNSYGRLFYQDGEPETSATSPYGASGTCAVTNGCAVLNSASVPITNAWTAVEAWMIGNEMTTGCAPDASGNIWSCGLIIGGTTSALAVWDSSQSCTDATMQFVSASAGVAQVIAASGGVWSFSTGLSVAFSGSGLSGPNAGPFTVTGLATTTTTNDTLLLSDPGALVTNQSGIAGAAASVSTYNVPSATWAHYRKLDDDPTLHSVTGSYPTATVSVGWKPILLVP